MSRVPAPAGHPWWLPYESVLPAHLRQPFQLHLYQLPVYWTLTECRVQPHCYWKGFVIWEIASNKAQKAHAPTYVSYRFQLDGSNWSWAAMCNFLDAAPVSWLCCALVCRSPDALRSRPHSASLSLSPRSLTPAISCEIWEDFSLRSQSPSLRWADLCCRGGRVGSNLHCNMSRSVASSIKLHWSDGYRTRLQLLPE